MKTLISFATLSLLLLPILHGQTPQNGFMRVLCVKAKDSKYSELKTFMTDTVAKLAKVRVEAGDYTSFVLTEAVAPAGRSAKCDFQLVYGTSGFPGEVKPLDTAALQKAGLKMTVEERNTKRDSISYLVSTEYWRARDLVGKAVKGGYARVNLYKAKGIGDWMNMELTGWKPLAKMMADEAEGSGWGVYYLALPGGTNLPYNGMTVDLFPNWAAVGAPNNARARWMKLHPQQDLAAYLDKLGSVAERVEVNTFRLLEVIRRP